MPHFPNILGKWAQFIKAFISQGSMSNEFMYVVDAHFIDKIEKMISWTQVPVVHIITRVCKISTGTCFIQKIYALSPLPYFKVRICPFPLSRVLRLNIFRLFVIQSLTQLYRYTPEIFLFSTATFKYTYRAPLRRIGQEYSANVAFSTFKSLKRIQPLPVCPRFFICIRNVK